MKLFAGIDPGKTGALSLVDNRGCIVDMCVMPLTPDGPDCREIKRILLGWSRLATDGFHVALEKGQTMPKQGGVSVFNYGHGCGILYGILSALELPFTFVRPAVWTKVMHQGTDDGEAKARSLVAACRLWPIQTWLPTDRCKKPHDGLVDATLIAEWCRRVVG
jgi:crossover junction endodeoxyribonuclease RuvC